MDKKNTLITSPTLEDCHNLKLGDSFKLISDVDFKEITHHKRINHGYLNKNSVIEHEFSYNYKGWYEYSQISEIKKKDRIEIGDSYGQVIDLYGDYSSKKNSSQINGDVLLIFENYKCILETVNGNLEDGQVVAIPGCISATASGDFIIDKMTKMSNSRRDMIR